MTDKPQNDHETNKNTANDSEGVGYRKPPQHKKCKKESGIPEGRRKRHQTEDCGDLFDRISNEKIRVYENGRATSVRGRPLLAESIVNRGIAGHPECENMLIKIERPDLTPPGGASISSMWTVKMKSQREPENCWDVKDVPRTQVHPLRPGLAGGGRGMTRHSPSW